MGLIHWELKCGPHLFGGPGRLSPFELKSGGGEAVGASQGRRLEKGVPNVRRPRLNPGARLLGKTKGIEDGGKEWGREYGWARGVERELGPGTEWPFAKD